MITTSRLIILLAVFPIIAYAAPVALQKDMSFLAARKLLLKEKWTPINVHAHDDYALIGVEHELAKKNIKEFDSCSIDYSNCLMRYRRGEACLTVYTVGEVVKDMKVVDWSEECHEQPPPAAPPQN